MVEADKLEFTEVVASITPSDLYLPDLTPISPLRFQVCGHVSLTVPPPSSTSSVTLEQGSVEDITFSGQRVAFRCTGRVTSLNGHPLEGVIGMIHNVHGSGGSECTIADESTTAGDGQYNVHGVLVQVYSEWRMESPLVSSGLLSFHEVPHHT